MHHKPIQLTDVSFFLPHKTCFEAFHTQIHYGSRIALIGQNGSGKSTLLKFLHGTLKPCSGEINIPKDVNVGYIPQIIESFNTLSGGERFNKTLSQVLGGDPDVLLLDEPTNHLDSRNRKSFLRMLQTYPGTLILVSHDIDLLIHAVDIIWHIDHGKIRVFTGNYEDYVNELTFQRSAIEHEVGHLKKQKKEIHQSLMKEQVRAAKSRSQGEKNIAKRKWPTVVSKVKGGRASKTTDKINAVIGNKKQALLNKLAECRVPEIIVPSFDLTVNKAHNPDHALVMISRGSIGYKNSEKILNHLSLFVGARDKIAINGDNGVGKTTLIKAILGEPDIVKLGEWFCPKIEDVGYLDQQYQTFSPDKSVLEILQERVPYWAPIKIRRHLGDFLFRKNEEVTLVAGQLSGGEKARLSLALIAAKTPKLLILDEITNNLDLTTGEHVTQVLKNYPGAMIVISHDERFLKAIDVTDRYVIKNRKLERE